MTLESVRRLLERVPALAGCAGQIAAACDLLVGCLLGGGVVFTCGNGGSMADCLHMAAELVKPYLLERRLRPGPRLDRLLAEPDGPELAAYLREGLRVQVLGADAPFATAQDNDSPMRHLGFAQHLWAFGREGDALVTVSTSGRSHSVLHAVSVARALNMRCVVALTGSDGGPLAERADVAIRVPAERVDRVQELHAVVCHAICEAIEASAFGDFEDSGAGRRDVRQ